MAVRIFSNNLPDLKTRAAVEQAVLEAIGDPAGDWTVQINEPQNSASWHVTILGPDKFHWSREFLPVEEQSDTGGFGFIKKTIGEVFSRATLGVYLSYAYPDNKDGFVTQFSNLLAQELRVQTGESVEVSWDSDRMRADSTWSSVNRATVLLALLSPSYFRTDECQKEFETFLGLGPLTRQRQRQQQIVPIYFVTAAQIEKRTTEPQGAWVRTLMQQKVFDFREHRFDLSSIKAQQAIVALAAFIHDLHKHRSYPRMAPQRAGSSELVEEAEPIYVESLRLKDFRCFDQLDLKFDRPSSLEGYWTCIAGINGSGKSTILQALGIALLGNPLALELGGERLNRMRSNTDLLNRKRAEIELNLRSSVSPKIWCLNLAIDEGRIVSVTPPSLVPLTPFPSLASPADDLRNLVIVGYGATRNLSARTDSANDHLSPNVRHQISLFDPLSQLAVAEVLLEHQSASWEFLNLLRNVVQQLFDDEFKIDLGGSAGIRFIVSGKDTVDAIDLPDGFRSVLSWLADLCLVWCEKAPILAASGNPADIYGIVLIDEIDLHLHPRLQRSLIPRLRKAFPKVQWIVTTHSPLVLANFDAEEIIALDRDCEGKVRELDRQILGWTSDEIYEWLMGTRPVGEEFEEQLRKSDAGVGKAAEEVATLMRASPEVNEETAQKQVAEFKSILKSLNN